MKIDRTNQELVNKALDYLEEVTGPDEEEGSPAEYVTKKEHEELKESLINLIDAINSNMVAKMRADGLKSFSDKYSEKISPYRDAFRNYDDEKSDLLEVLYDTIDAIKRETPKFDDELESQTVDKGINDLKNFFEELGVPIESLKNSVVEIEIEPKEAHIEEKKIESEEESHDKYIKNILNQIEKIKLGG